MPTLIHPTAVIHAGAQLHPTVQVGPYTVIGERVKIGSGTIVASHVVIDGWTEIGANNRIFPGAAIGLEPQDLKYDGSLTLVKIGDHNLIREYVTINRATLCGEATVLGNHNLLMAYAHVGHNCVLEDQVIIANGVALAGHVYIESMARISGVLGVHQFVHIGRLAMVGGMSRIDRDVPPFMLVEGNPGRVRSLNLVGLKRAGLAESTKSHIYSSLKKAFRLLYRSQLTLQQSLDYLSNEMKQEGSPYSNDYLTHLVAFLVNSCQSNRRGPLPGRSTGQLLERNV
ncbi:MAG: acyl-ACP--UDP-N-acetylglucosamine O-acyltransferase [Cyanobacteria bacterium WB6_1B_304]|nr:acyl-ACP--UDP-N-acetylglucosamine O-acyltransferase [Cyanobacteria bacterium WB6_1B_304]